MRYLDDAPNGRKMIKTKSGLRILVVFNLLSMMYCYCRTAIVDDGKIVTRLYQTFSVVQIMPS
jgi:hypothetical protein